MTASMDVLAGHLRVGEVAAQTGTTPRTIRYYEEIGLLTPDCDRPKGVHRLYSVEDVARIREVVRLRDLLGVSLEQLSTLIEVESVRRHLKDEWAGATKVADQQRILAAALQCADTQLGLVQRRKQQLAQLEGEVRARRDAIEARLRALPKRRGRATSLHCGAGRTIFAPRIRRIRGEPASCRSGVHACRCARPSRTPVLQPLPGECPARRDRPAG